jgi:hypothetical protein
MTGGRLAAMLDEGWTLEGLAVFYDIDVKEVVRLIMEYLKKERQLRRS